MPKTKKKLEYKEEDLQRAIEAVKNGMPKAKAAVVFSVPRSTIQFRLNQKILKTSRGPNPFLTKEEEKTLVKWISESVQKGFPRRKDDLLYTVKDFFEKSGRPNPFKNNMPGPGWYRKFLNRNRELRLRIPEAVTPSSANVSEENIKGWFDNIQNYLISKNYFNILSHPERVFNGDETGFQLCPKQKTVLAPKGCKNVYEIDSGPAKTNVTVMFTFSAEGTVTPPMIIYPLKRMSTKIQQSVPDEYGIGLSENGWMKAELFFEYISNVLHPFLVKSEVEFPVILFVDGHKTHLTYKLSCLCTSLGIILIALYPNSTRILQPADVAAFRPIKSGWQNAVLKWRREHPFESITKDNFAPILKTVVDDIKATTIVNGFRATGLYPWNKDAIDYSKCLGKNFHKSFTVNIDSENENHTQPNSNLLYAKFLSILGEEKLQEIKSIEVPPHDENLKYLWKIYRAFFDTENIDGDNQNVDAINIENQDSQSRSKTENNSSEVNLVNTEITFSEADETVGNKQIFDINDIPIVLYDDIKSANEENSIDISLENQNYHNEDLKNNLEIIGESQVEEENNDITFEINENVNNTNPNINITQIIRWPVTPQRKGKQLSNKEKLPYVITSSGWKKLQEEKDEAKQKVEEEKEERKRQRMIKKEEKAASKDKKKKNSTASRQKTEKPAHVKRVFEDEEETDRSNKKAAKKEGENTVNKESFSKLLGNEKARLNATATRQKNQKPSHVRRVFEDEGENDWSNKKAAKKEGENTMTEESFSKLLGNEETRLNATATPQKIEKPSHVRRVFEDEGENDWSNKKAAKKEGENTVTEESFSKLLGNEEAKLNAFCFGCAKKITKALTGIKCAQCKRNFHYLCLFKKESHLITSNVFVCKACKSKQ